jgi:hypothetical protein
MCKIKGKFVAVHAMKACGTTGGIHKITNRAVAESERSASILAQWPPYPLNRSMCGPQNRSDVLEWRRPFVPAGKRTTIPQSTSPLPCHFPDSSIVFLAVLA